MAYPNVEFAVAVEDSPGAGTYGAFTTVGIVVVQPNGQARITLGPAPNDGRTYQIKARHVAPGWTPSAYTEPVIVDPWGATVTPPSFGVLVQATDTVPIWYGIAGPLTIGPIPAALTDLDPAFRPWKHIPERGYVRLCAVVTTPATAAVAVGLEQSPDNTTWADIVTTTLRLRLNQAGPIRTPWLAVASGASGDRILRAVMVDGDDAGSVSGTLCWAEFLLVPAGGTAPCVEVWRERFSDYADTAAMLAVWDTEVDPNGTATWTLDNTRALEGTHSLRFSRTGDTTTGWVFSLSREVSGLLSSTTYTLRRTVYRTGTVGAGVIANAWDPEESTVVTDGSGVAIVTLTFSISVGTSGTSADKWFDDIWLERCA
jgi:hypothetical protein